MIDVIRTRAELIRVRESLIAPWGFVPTMGNLHAGHISLLLEAHQDFDIAFFSIFVNPKQFGPSEDFQKYPRTLEQDLERIQASLAPGKRVIVFAPSSVEEIYPADDRDIFSVLHVTEEFEGALRPGHFNGVATVVYKLFDLVKPSKAYFGLKDYQQFLVIKQLVKDLCLPIEIVGMPIVREESGLAMSSRNQYLSPEQKAEGLTLSQTLYRVRDLINQNRENLPQAQTYIASVLKDPRWNYLELRDAETLSKDLRHSRRLTLLGVFQLGTTRLLDNLQLELR